MKSDLRKKIKNIRNNMDITNKMNLDNLIYNRIINSKNYIKSKVIFVYVSLKEEVDTHRLINKALLDGKSVCVPKIISKDEGMEAIKINKFQDLHKSKYDILEPLNFENKVDREYIDLILIPGISFDLKGGRIGYGGGFYDRFLNYNNLHSKNIGLCYEFQIVKKVPMDGFDMGVHGIITESREMYFN
jgi:5-formyltetrahydrofolate cyclo-ligase